MIKLISSSAELLKFADDPYYTRIAGVAAAYGFDYSFALFWRQICEETGQVTALIASFDRNLTLCARERADFDELAEFLGAIGGESLLCAAQVGEKLGLSGGQTCTALKFVSTDTPPAQTSEIRLEALYELLISGEDGGIKMPPFEAWYVDLSHRIRHGAARMVALAQDGTPVAAAITSAETHDAALISGVATLPQFRGQGYGRSAVCTLAQILKTEGKTAFVFARDEEKNFYLKCGFTPIGEAIEYTFCEE